MEWLIFPGGRAIVEQIQFIPGICHDTFRQRQIINHTEIIP